MADTKVGGDDLFEVSEEALLNTDFDEDADFEPEEEVYDPDELDELAGDADIPLEQLRAMYGYGGGAVESDESSTVAAIGGAMGGAVEDLAVPVPTEVGASATVTATAEEDDSTWPTDEQRAAHASLMRLVADGSPADVDDASEGDEEDDDVDYQPQPPSPTLDWRREIRQGEDYQASVPDVAVAMDSDSCLGLEPEPMWRPGQLNDVEVRDYLQAVQRGQIRAVAGAPDCAYAPDDEAALKHLVVCDYNTKLALSSLPLRESIPPWSEEECCNFEEGLSKHGKNFFKIQKEKVPHRSVAELIEFFYLWKKTERYIFFRRTNPVKVFAHRTVTYPTTAAPIDEATAANAASAARPNADDNGSKTKNGQSTGSRPSSALASTLLSASTCLPAQNKAASPSTSASLAAEPPAKRPYLQS